MFVTDKASLIFASKAGAHPGGVPEPPTLSIALFYIENDAEIFPAHYTCVFIKTLTREALLMGILDLLVLTNLNQLVLRLKYDLP